MSSHNSARARIEALTGVVAGIDTASTTVKRFFNGVTRGMSEAKLHDGQQALCTDADVKTGDHLLLVRLLLFDRFFFGGMRVKHVRAAVKTAVEKEQRSEQEAFPGGKAHESNRGWEKDFLHDPLPPVPGKKFFPVMPHSAMPHEHEHE